MIAKRFFYVCAGLLCLALAYHLGAASVAAKANTRVEAANVEATGTSTYYTCVVGRTFYYTPSPPAVFTVPQPVPGTVAVVFTGTDGIYLTAVLSNGDIYQWDGGSAWLLRGNLVASG